jgi:hypothetical protein
MTGNRFSHSLWRTSGRRNRRGKPNARPIVIEEFDASGFDSVSHYIQRRPLWPRLVVLEITNCDHADPCSADEVTLMPTMMRTGRVG